MPPVVETQPKTAQANFRVVKCEGVYVDHRINGPMLVQQFITLAGDFTLIDEDGRKIFAKCDPVRIELKR